MADGNDHAGEVQQEVLQPVDGLDVQVVGRLVQHDNVGVAEEGLSQQYLHLETGVNGGHLVIVKLCTNTKALQQPGGIGFRFPAAHFRKLRFQVGGPEAVLVGKVGLFVDGVLFLHHVVQMLVAHDHGVQNREIIIGVLVLFQNGDPLGGVNGNGTGGGIQLSGEQAQECGLARAVGADDTIAVAGEELKIHMLEQPLTAELHS